MLPCENRLQRRPGDGVALVQIRIEMRADRNKEIDAQANDDDQRCDREKLGPQQHARIRHPDVRQDSRRDEDAHQVIGGAECDQIHHDEEQVIATRLGRLIGPSHREPEHERDGQHAQRVDLLVHHRLVPHGEHRGAHERARRRGQTPPHILNDDRSQPALGDQKPESSRHGAGYRCEQVNSPCVFRSERQQPPHMRENHEEWIPGRMGNAQRMRGRDVLGCVPELSGGSERRDVQQQGANCHARRHHIGRTCAGQCSRGSGHVRRVI